MHLSTIYYSKKLSGKEGVLDRIKVKKKNKENVIKASFLKFTHRVFMEKYQHKLTLANIHSSFCE